MLEVVTEADGYQDADDDGGQEEKVFPGKEMEISGRRHFVETTADGGVYDGDTKDTKPSACPERHETDANVGTDDVYDPVRGKRRDAEDDEERNDVVLLLTEFFGPCVETSLPLWNGEECGAKGGADKVAKSSAGSDAGAGEGEGDGDTPYCAAEDGKIHGAWDRESLEAIEGE